MTSVHPDGSIAAIAHRYVDDLARLDPTGAARMSGVALDARVLTDVSPEGEAERIAWWRRVRAELDAAPPPADEAERLGARYLRDETAGLLALAETGEARRMVSPLVGPPAAFRLSFDLIDRSGVEGWEVTRDRLADVPRAIEGYRRSLAAGLAEGSTAARRLVVAVAGQCRTWAGTDGTAATSWFSDDVQAADGVVAPALAAELRAAAEGAAAAYDDLAAWLVETYAPAAAPHDGVGTTRYRRWAAHVLGVDLDIAEAEAWATDELARLEAEKAAVSARILPGASFAEVRRLLEHDPERAIDGVDAYRAWLQAVTDEAIDGLDGVEFDIAGPLRRCEVAIPPLGSAAAPYYTPPSEDLSQPGRTWWPTLGETRFPTWDKVTTAYHEAVPGHHLQFGATRLTPLTRAHQLAFSAGHGEGWALYAERLMDELGWFSTPDTRLGFLSMQALRAARVVVDIGLHTHRPIPGGLAGAGEPWTFDRAVALVAAAGGSSPAFAESEVLRYLSWPAQATCYKLGERAWLAGRIAANLRADRNGRRFDRRAWHARALALGPLGLDTLTTELAAC
jgi:uncharacterized protein (DUF885 family)